MVTAFQRGIRAESCFLSINFSMSLRSLSEQSGKTLDNTASIHNATSKIHPKQTKLDEHSPITNLFPLGTSIFFRHKVPQFATVTIS